MDKCRWAKIKIQKRNPWLSKPEWRFEDKTLNFKVSEGAEQKPRHINYHIYNFHLKKINHRRSSFKFSKCLFLKLKPLNSAPPIISIFNEKEWPFRNGMLFPTAALVVQFSGSDFVASWQVTKDLYGCCGCGCCRGLWFPWEFFGVATVESCPWFSKRIPQKKKNLEMAIGIYWESASYHPRYTDILVGMKDLCFGASKKPLQPAPPTLHEFRPSWTDSPSLDQLGKMIQAALLWEHSWWRCVGLKNRVSSFRFPPVSTQKSQRPENTRNLPFSRGSKSQSHKLLARIFVESLVNCLGNGHSAWVDSLLDSVPCTKKSGTAE